MKVVINIMVSLLLIAFQGHSANILINGKAYRVDTVANFSAGPGIEYMAVEFKGEKQINAFFLKVDITNPYITYRAALGRDSIYGGEQPTKVAERKSKRGEMYIAGTNGDFYYTRGYVGLPLGYTVINGEMGNNPYDKSREKVFAFDKNKVPYIGNMSYSGSLKVGKTQCAIHHINHLREAEQLVLYNRYNGKSTHTAADGTEVLVKLSKGESWGINKTIRLKVVSVERNKGNMSIPQDGYAVLSGNGSAAKVLNALKVGSEVSINLNLTIDNNTAASFTDVVGGDPRQVLVNGVPSTTDVWNELHPRTGFGYSKDKKAVLHCVIDGRSSVSVGATTKDLAEIMSWAGAYTAMNIDGGGSSCLFLKDFGPMNKTSDGRERAVSNGIYILSTAPTDSVIRKIQSVKTKVRLPRYSTYKPTFCGYNKYGVLVSKDVKGVKLTAEPTVGEILPNGSFVASGTQSGNVTATYNGITTIFWVELTPEQP